MIEVVVDQRKIRAVQRLLAAVPKGWRRVASRAVNHTARKARTRIVQELRRRLKMRSTDIRKDVTLRRASYANPEARIRIGGKPIPLVRFQARQTARGVTYRQPSTGRRVLSPHSFIATMRTGHRGVFRRRRAGGKRVGRLPINELTGKSLLGLFEAAPALARGIMAETSIELERRLDHEVRHLLERRAARRAG